jgi:hypothetical protein
MSSTSSTPKSPILAAIGISFAIALGSIISSLDMAQVEEVATGQFLTRPLAEAQQRNASAITTLEHTVGAISKDIDFVTARVGATIRRNEDQAYDRFAHLDAEIAALKDKIAGIQHASLVQAQAAEPPQDITGLRSSLHDLNVAHAGAVTAINKRLERIEVMVGLTTDMTSSVSDPTAKVRRVVTAAKQAKKRPPAETAIPVAVPAMNAVPATDALPAANAAPATSFARPERGHLFNVKPLSQQGAPLRISRLPG